MASKQTTTSKITLDLYAKNVVAVNAKQYDDETRYIEITCVENGVIYTLDKTIMSAFLRLKKPDDNGVFNEVEITDKGKIKIVLTEQMLAASGRAIADVFLIRRVFTSNEKPTDIDDIYKVNAPIISIMDFYINITPTALNHSQIESSYEFNALTNALAQIDFNNKKVVELDKTLTANENVRQNNENVRKSNEEQRVSAENVRINSEKQRLNAESIRNQQEATRVSNEQKRIDSENTRVSNENVRKSNEDTRKSNETQRQLNENKRISAESTRENSETKRQSNETQREQNEKLRKNNEDQRISNEQTRVSNEKSRNDAEAARIKNENTRISNETTRQSQESKRQTDTATAITNANNAAKNANDKANDLQNKLDNNYFVLTNELENSVSSTSTTYAPTANAVKIAYDKAVSVENTINSNKNNWNDKYTKNEIDNKFSTLENNINWKESVNTFADIAKTYPKPEDGWTVNVKDTDYTYRYSGSTWVAISANAIPKATQTLDGLMSKEDKTNYDDANSKKHTHSNKSVLDGITSALVTTWNTVTNKLDKTGDASNVTNTITTASTRSNLSTGEKLSISLGKIAKWFSDLKIVAFSGSYNDLSNKPSSMPANGGNSTTVNGHTVNSDVPANAKFTDTNTWRPLGTTADTACAGNDSRLSNARPASDVYSWAKQVSKPSYSWSEITGKPSSFTPASHTHNYIPTSASCNKNWNWSGKNGQPKWLWGGDDGANMYVYNPSNFSVNYANSAGSVAWANVSGKPSNYTPSSHASTATTYGKGTATNYGHVKLTDVYTSSLGDASSGVAPSQLALYGLYNYVKTNELWTKYVSIGTVNGITLYYRYNNLGMCEIYFNGNLSNNISAYDTSFKWTNEIPKKPLNRILIPVVAQQNGLCLLCYPGEINWCLFSYQGTISKGTFICGSHIYTYK